MANAIFVKICRHLNVTQPFTCFRVNQVYMFLNQSSIFISSPLWIFISSLVGFIVSTVGFLIFPLENVLLGLTPEKFWKFGIFPGESSSPSWGIETGCLKGEGDFPSDVKKMGKKYRFWQRAVLSSLRCH